MEIGKPQRTHRVEPLKDPVPAKSNPDEELPQTAAPPKKVTAA